jgi:cysteine synthase A
MAIATARHRIIPPTGKTPIAEISLSVVGIKRFLKLKLESYNPYGSLKDRVAAALITSVLDRVDNEVGIIESTSGNLGVAMAAICRDLSVNFTAVVDPRASPLLIERMRQLGATVKIIDESDSMGGYQLSRIRYVHSQLAARPGLIWTNQYESTANPEAHFQSTAPELWKQLPPGPRTILIPVSTGGTLAGFTRFAKSKDLAWRLIGVDMTGSAALGGVPGQRLLSGIGGSQNSNFLNLSQVEAMRVGPAEAISACLWLSSQAGIDVGGSSGAALAAALRTLRADPELRDLVCMCPDGGDRYLTTIYQASWREEHGVTDADVGDDIKLLQVQRIA